MNENSSNSIPPEMLGAYADGELDQADRERVESWLAAHPETLADLLDQESLAPRNADFWQTVAAPMPTEAAWNRAYERIQGVAMPMDSRPGSPLRYRGSWHLAPVLAMASVAAGLLMIVTLIDRQRPGNVGSADRPSISAGSDEDDDPIFRVATVDDVELVELPEAATSLIVVGKHPMADVPLILAGPSDVIVLNYGPDELGNLPDLGTTMGANASMLWAPDSPGKP